MTSGGANKPNHMRLLVCAAAIASAICLSHATAQAQGEGDFYARKNIRFLAGTAAGGGFSTYAMLLAPHLGKFIPGNPSVTVEHLPGVGGINSLNYLANAAPRDGAAIAIAMPNFFVTPWTEPKAAKSNPAGKPAPEIAATVARVMGVTQ
ncbi:MAG: hypothetical protein FJX29_07030 [Alphaproteobacteria bacterium]|nr:hypothetical protein [Alphaproteobacteria bacterium]